MEEKNTQKISPQELEEFSKRKGHFEDNSKREMGLGKGTFL